MRTYARVLAPALLLVLASSTRTLDALQPPFAGALLFSSAGEVGGGPGGGPDPASGTEASFGYPVSFRSPDALPDLRNRAFILCWHTFLGQPSIDTDFSLAELASQVDALLKLGYRFITLEDLLFGRFEGKLNLVATMDDGHRTVPSACDKVFAARGIVPSLFVYPSVIGTTSYSMDEVQLRALRDSGCFVGAHGYYHLYVTESLYKSDPALFEKEVFTAKTRVETLAGLPIYAYAYPFGALSPITKREVQRAGYSFAFAVKRGFVYADERLNDLYELPRSVVTRENWAELYTFLARNAGKR